jgi:2-oxoglutarate ferredoxin oxidoreductase subunit alpha
MASGIGEAMRRFRRVMTIENNWSDRLQDELIDADNRRYSALAMMLRARFLVDVDCWSESRGRPMKPGAICEEVRTRLDAMQGEPA